jgi:uncharacterized protein YkwD
LPRSWNFRHVQGRQKPVAQLFYELKQALAQYLRARAAIKTVAIKLCCVSVQPADRLERVHRYHGPMKFIGAMTAALRIKVKSARGSAARSLALLLLGTLLATSAQARVPGPEHPSLLRALNALRLQGCKGRPGPASTLLENPRLSRAAALVAGGSKFSDALKAADYRATRAAQITLRSTTAPAALTRGAVGKSCNTIMQGELAEAGFHQRGNQTWIVLAAPFTPPATAQAGNAQARVLALVNQARARPRRCGRESFAAAGPVRLNPTLQHVASGHAADMARYNYFSHTSRDGGSLVDRASRAGYPRRAMAENIAAGQLQADAAVQSWLESPGHCANIMAPAFNEMGVAFAVNSKSSMGIYWVQLFGAAR